MLTAQFSIHFRRYNVTLPSSASVERLFSQGGHIFTPKRWKLTDKNIQMLLFLKVNHKVFKNGDRDYGDLPNQSYL